MRKLLTAVALVALAACSKEETKEKATAAAEKVEQAWEAAVPLGKNDDPAAREKQRFDDQWRALESFREAVARRELAERQVQVTFAPNGKESFESITPATIASAPVVVPIKGDMAGPSVLKTQVYLDRVNFSPGVIDGRWGRNAAIALWWYQRSRGIEAAEQGAVDEATFRALASETDGAPALVQRTLTAEDVEGPFVSLPEDVYEKAELSCLCYESKAEKLAELFHSTPDFLAQLNEDVDFSALKAGDRIWVPNVREPVTAANPDIARIVVSIRGNTLNGFDAQGNLVFHAPTTVGSKYDPSPRETTEVKSIHRDPHFHYQPKLFHEVPDTDPEAHLKPGPNSPVGVVWMALSKPHFGIHGTSDPDGIGYDSSHGCVRLTNWDAKEVAGRIRAGVPVEFLDTRRGAAS